MEKNFSERRPDPDALLAKASQEEAASRRGRLKVYLGMAAGVGKTYSMLSAAQESKRRGVDVVIAYVEPHGRSETESLVEGLEQIPLRTVVHQGAMLRELDLDATLERHPQLVLVDELAHTNAPGLRHKKRWQDVLELIEAGIDVSTTINIQHLESLNDVVAQVTGVVVKETVPDSLINDADEVKLVDIPPEELVKRIQEGKVYVPEKVNQALEGFFKKRNLLALRELSLRHTADRVEEQVKSQRRAEGAHEPWHTSTRILVCVAPNKMAGRVVRASKRMANALHAELIAVFVESSRQASLSGRDRQYAADALRLAETIGAESVTLNGDDIVKEVLRLAQSRNVTTIVVGKPIRPRWRDFVFGSVVDSLVRASGEIDVHFITGTDDLGTPLRLNRRAAGHDWKGYGLALIVTVAATAVSALMVSAFAPANLVMVYILGIAYVASKSSSRAAVLASLLGVLAFDVFFVPPQGTLAVTDIQYLFTFIVMLVVGLLISTLTARLREQSVAASERERRTSALYGLSKKLSSTRSRTEIGLFATQQIKSMFSVDVAVLIRSTEGKDLFEAPGSESGFERDPKELAVAHWVVENGKRAGKGTDTLPGSVGLYLPLNAEQGCVGALAILGGDTDTDDLGSLHLLETVANQLAIAIERTNLAKASHAASLNAERERLRSTLLSSVSHDLRTPLSVITGNAEQLADSLDPSVREAGKAIFEESQRLERLVRNLLDMTKLESGHLELNATWESVEELLGSAIGRVEQQLADNVLEIEIPENLPLFKVDGALVEQAFVNTLENAAKHTPKGTAIKVLASVDGAEVIVRFENDGPAIPEANLQTLFEKFSRADSSEPGTGLGLAICRAIMDAHGGSVSVENLTPAGVRFSLRFPLTVKVPEVPRD